MTMGAMHLRRRAAVLAAGTALSAGTVLSACSNSSGSVDGPEPTPEVSAAAIPSGEATSTDDDATDQPSSSDDPSATESATDGPSEPTDTDRARFAADYRPQGASDLEHVQADLNGDGIDEVVFVYVRGGEGVGHVDIAAWDPETGEYGIVTGADGGVADRIDRVRIGDLNLDGVVEVALFQERGSSGRSVNLWAAREGRLVAQPARGGCHDGSTSFGVIGVSLEDRDGDGAVEIRATCDDSPLPASAWSSDTYVWQDNAWRHDPELS